MKPMQVETLKKVFSFVFWGILTTALNIGLYYLFRLIRIPVSVSTALAWFLCVLFAFITNKKYVFRSKGLSLKKCLKEAILFYSSRLLSGILDVALMVLFVDILGINEIIAKVTDEILVSTFNFVFSFLVVFR